MTTAPVIHRLSPGELQAKYARYCAKRKWPISFNLWQFFYEEGLRGASLNTMTPKQRSTAGKAGAAKRWGKKV